MLDPFANKLLLLFRDLAQLLPICKHSANLCLSCLPINSTHFQHASFHHMSFLVQHASDIPFLEFLQTIKNKQPTQSEIDQILSDCIVQENESLQHIDKQTTIICTHKEDVHKYNHIILMSTYKDEDIIPIDLKTNAPDVPCLQNWLEDSSFNKIQDVAFSATCLITKNIDLNIGAMNGAICIVDNVCYGSNNILTSIQVTILSTKSTMNI